MTKSEIKNKRELLERKLSNLENEYLKERQKLWDQQKELTKQCKHRNMNGG